MKFTLPTTALAALLGLALTGAPVTAETTPDATATPTPAPSAVSTSTSASTSKAKTAAKTTTYKGTLTAIDASGNSITVTGTKRTLVLQIAATTKYKKSAPALSDFAVGDKVSGSYTKDATGALTAYSVHKLSSKKTVASAKPAAPVPTPTPATAATPASTVQ